MVIVISNPSAVCGEHQTIRALFEEGLELFHLRKKDYCESRLRQFIEGISMEHYKSIVLHSHYHLVDEYGLKGIHVPTTYQGSVAPKGKSLSVSFHSTMEIICTKLKFDYGFLSPVFDSISKTGYRGNPDLKKVGSFLKSFKEVKIAALGGVDLANIDLLKSNGFWGIALLGAVWQSEDPIRIYKTIKNNWEATNLVL